MKRADYLILFLLQLLALLWVARQQSVPGNLDADYYFMGGLRLAQGEGFTANYIWNYFNDPVSLPLPSHGYWLPLASILTALGMWLTGEHTFEAGRLAFIVIAAFVPPLTSALAYKLTSRRDLAIFAGLFSICSGFYFPFLPITENYGVLMLLGALYFLLADRRKPLDHFLLGLISGLMSLTRSDGLMWLMLTFLLIFVHVRKDWSTVLSKPALASFLTSLSLAFAGFLFIMLPWYLRNLNVFGAWMPPGTRRALWINDYYQTFIYPASSLTFQSWLADGWQTILSVRVSSLFKAISNVFFVQGVFVFTPFMLVGVWHLRADLRVRLALLAWAGMFFAFVFVFPLAGFRGSYIHAVCAIQPLLYALTPIGLESVIKFLTEKLKVLQLKYINTGFQIVLFLLAALITYASFSALVLPGWHIGELDYPDVEEFLLLQGIGPEDPVMILNPPGYVMMTGRPAIMAPFGGEPAILSAAAQFKVRYLVTADTPDYFGDLAQYKSLNWVGNAGSLNIYRIEYPP